MKHKRGRELDSLLTLAARTKVLREIRADFPCGLAVEIHPDGRIISRGRRPKGNLWEEVESLLHIGVVEITASHGVTGRMVRLGVSALLY